VTVQVGEGRRAEEGRLLLLPGGLKHTPPIERVYVPLEQSLACVFVSVRLCM
jgi:hypothetical protein